MKSLSNFLTESTRFEVSDFNLDNAPEKMVQYAIDNIEDFDRRYSKALTKMDRNRCPLRYADEDLYTEIQDRMTDWCNANGDDVDNYDIEVIFG